MLPPPASPTPPNKCSWGWCGSSRLRLPLPARTTARSRSPFCTVKSPSAFLSSHRQNTLLTWLSLNSLPWKTSSKSAARRTPAKHRRAGHAKLPPAVPAEPTPQNRTRQECARRGNVVAAWGRNLCLAAHLQQHFHAARMPPQDPHVGGAVPDALGMGHGAGRSAAVGRPLLSTISKISAANGRFLSFANFPQYSTGSGRVSIPKVFPVDRYDIIKAAKSREVFSMRKNFGAKAFSYLSPFSSLQRTMMTALPMP